MTITAPSGDGRFQTTHWSVVRRAIDSDGSSAEAALGTLCAAYWYPLYAYFRRAGRGAHDAEDLTQALFVRLLSGGTFAKADPSRGKLRSFLLTCARHFLADEGDRARAQKRAAPTLAHLDVDEAEARYTREPVDHLSPDRLFQRRWALTILESSLAVMAEEFAAKGKRDIFEQLRPFLGFGSGPEQSYEELAGKLGQPLGTVKNHVFRLRTRWREVLFERVGATLDDPTPEQIKGELSELLGCV